MNGDVVYVFSVFGAICGVCETQGEAESKMMAALEQAGTVRVRRLDGPKGVPEEMCGFFADNNGRGKPVGFWGRFKIGEGAC